MFIKEKYNELLLIIFLLVLFNYAFCFYPENELNFEGLYKQTVFLIFISWFINKLSYNVYQIKKQLNKIKEKYPKSEIRNTDLFYSKNDLILRLSVAGLLLLFMITDWSWLILAADFFFVIFSMLAYQEYRKSKLI